MFGLGFGEIMVIAILALVVVGPSRLPTLMKTVGGAMRQLRQASRDIRTSVGLDELIDLDGPKPTRTVTTRVRAPQDAAPAAQLDAPHSQSAPDVAPVAHAVASAVASAVPSTASNAVAATHATPQSVAVGSPTPEAPREPRDPPAASATPGKDSTASH
jgi:sec-independent protein translocase protein TatB